MRADEGGKPVEAKAERDVVVVKRRSSGAGSVMEKIKVQRCELEQKVMETKKSPSATLVREDA